MRQDPLQTEEPTATAHAVPIDLTKQLVRRVLIGLVAVQGVVLALLLLDIPGQVAAGFGAIRQVGGLATIPLLICIATLAASAILLGLDQAGVVTMSRLQSSWCSRGLVYAGRIAWMLGLLQTMLSLYQVRHIFGAQLDYETMVGQLGDISGSAYGSSLIGGGTLLLGWIAQIVLTGRLED